MLDRSRIQGFGSDSIGDASKEKGFFGSIKDSFTGPAMNSAVDNVSLKVADAIEEVKEEMQQPWSPLQDISDMAQEIKSFVTGAVGIEQSAGADEDAEEEEAKDGAISPRQRVEAMNVISKFSQSYKHARVAPTPEELAQIWISCSLLQPNAVAGVIYDIISFSSGDFEWQPRLRILYLIEVLYWKGGSSQEIALSVHSHTEDLLKHLASEVPQTKEKAKQVLDTLNGIVPEAPPSIAEVEAAEAGAQKANESKSESKSKVEATALPKAALKAPSVSASPPQDLLDLTPTNSASTSSVEPVKAVSSSAQPAKASPPVDLLSVDNPVPAAPAMPIIAPPVVDLISIMTSESAASKAPSTPSAQVDSAFDPNRSAGSPSSNLMGIDFLAQGPGSRSAAGTGMMEGRLAELENQKKLAIMRDDLVLAQQIKEQMETLRLQASFPTSPSSPHRTAGLGGGIAMGSSTASPMGTSPVGSSGSSMLALGNRPAGYAAGSSPGLAMGANVRPPGVSSMTGGSQWGRTQFPTPLEMQNMMSDLSPTRAADPFDFAKEMMEDFTAGK